MLCALCCLRLALFVRLAYTISTTGPVIPAVVVCLLLLSSRRPFFSLILMPILISRRSASLSPHLFVSLSFLLTAVKKQTKKKQKQKKSKCGSISICFNPLTSFVSWRIPANNVVFYESYKPLFFFSVRHQDVSKQKETYLADRRPN